MPFYDFRCNVCGDIMPHFRKIEQRDLPAYHCSAEMTRVLSAPAIRPEISEYVSPASGKLISSRAQRRDDLAREGCVENEPGLKEHIAAQSAHTKEQSLKRVDEGIDRTVAEFHASNLI